MPPAEVVKKLPNKLLFGNVTEQAVRQPCFCCKCPECRVKEFVASMVSQSPCHIFSTGFESGTDRSLAEVWIISCFGHEVECLDGVRAAENFTIVALGSSRGGLIWICRQFALEKHLGLLCTGMKGKVGCSGLNMSLLMAINSLERVCNC